MPKYYRKHKTQFNFIIESSGDWAKITIKGREKENYCAGAQNMQGKSIIVAVLRRESINAIIIISSRRV